MNGLRSGQRLVFVGGLHRSGTTPLARVLAGHPQVSGFTGTGAKEDEGQHLQDVYPAARTHGGAGRFALSAAAHLTEDSPLATPENADRLLAAWTPHWDLERPVLLEKSPPNLLMTRFLQELFPEASFVVILRHPVVVALSTRKWLQTRSVATPMANWFAGHDLFRSDATSLRRLHVVRYEELVAEPSAALDRVARFLQLEGPVPADAWQANRSDGYAREWRSMAADPLLWRRWNRSRLVHRYQARAREFGYDLTDLDTLGPCSLDRT